MRSFHRTIFSWIAGRINTKLLSRRAQPVMILPFYHTVSDEYLPHIHPLYRPKNKGEFEKDIDFLSSLFSKESMETVYLYSKQPERLTKNAFHLSFDDGLRGVYENALPILFRKGIPATLFINKDFVDNRNLFYRHKTALLVRQLNEKEHSPAVRKEIENCLNKQAINAGRDLTLQARLLAIPYSKRELLDSIASLLEVDFQAYLKNHRPYLTTEELKEIQQKGFTIGAHSIDHPPFGELDEREQVRQTIESCVYVKEVFGVNRSYFSFPFSDEGIKDSFFQSIENQVDLTVGITGINLRQGGKLAGRIDMEKCNQTAKEAINTALLKYLIESVRS